MTAGRRPIYLQRRTYRLRRLIDACRLIPVLGILLWMIPLFWPQTGAEVFSTSYAIIYIFSVWVVLIALGGWVAARMPRDAAPSSDPTGPDAP